jgi:hypothetical protein
MYAIHTSMKYVNLWKFMVVELSSLTSRVVEGSVGKKEIEFLDVSMNKTVHTFRLQPHYTWF